MSEAGFTPGCVAIIGAGLLGGSFGLAIRSLYPSAQVVGVSRSQSSRQAAIDCGAVTITTDNFAEACVESDLIVVAVPVDRIAQVVIDAAKVCPDDATIIDMGSTKATIVTAIDQDVRARKQFVGTHPIAGSEKTGAENARADLFTAKPVIITPGKHTPELLVERVCELWKSLGSNVYRMTAAEHDDAVAAISHVPHIAASMIASGLPQEACPWIGSGWIDTTRVASGDAELWTAICRENAPAILCELQRSIEWLKSFSSHLAASEFESIQEMLLVAKQKRDAAIKIRK